MTDSYSIEPDVLAHDAEQFRGWSESLAEMRKAVPLDLDAGVFSALPGAGETRDAFHHVATMVDAYLEGGAHHLEALAVRLTATERVYTEAEAASAAAVVDLSGEMDTL